MRSFDLLVARYKMINEGLIGNFATAANPLAPLSQLTGGGKSSSNTNPPANSTQTPTTSAQSVATQITPDLIQRIQTNNKSTSLASKNVDHDPIILNGITSALKQYENLHLTTSEAITHITELITKNV